MTPDVGTVRAEKRQDRGLQSGFCPPGTLQEGLSTASRVINEVVLEGGFSEVRHYGVLGRSVHRPHRAIRASRSGAAANYVAHRTLRCYPTLWTCVSEASSGQDRYRGSRGRAG